MLEYVDLFMELICSWVIHRGEADIICWSPSSHKVFDVKSF